MRIVVGVLRGGPGEGYDASLRTGSAVLSALDKERYEPRDLFIDRTGQWHAHGLPAAPERALRGVDVAFNALHGPYGEDGSVPRLLEGLGVRYSGSGAYPAALAYNRPRARQAVAAAGIRVPYGTVIDGEKITDLPATARNLFRSLPQPSVVRPVAGGGAYVADNYHALEWALGQALARSPRVLVEEYIDGRPASVGVIENFRDHAHYALIPAPNVFTHEEKALLTDAAARAHAALDLAHYSQVRLRLGKRGVYFTGAYAQPHVHEGSSFGRALGEVGAPLRHFIEHVLTLARR